jgi:hypothetical protein
MVPDASSLCVIPSRLSPDLHPTFCTLLLSQTGGTRPALDDARSIKMATLLSHLTSPPAQSLRTLQPTSSTITYTVSSRPVPSTLPAKAIHYISILLRVLCGFAALVALWAKWFVKEVQSIEYLRAVVGGTEKEAQIIKFIASCPWICLAPGVAAVLFLVFRRGYTGTPHPPYFFLNTFISHRCSVLTILQRKLSHSFAASVYRPVLQHLRTSRHLPRALYQPLVYRISSYMKRSRGSKCASISRS